MFKHQIYSERVVKSLNFENEIYKDFEEYCYSQRMYPSHKLQELMVEFLESQKVTMDNDDSHIPTTPK